MPALEPLRGLRVVASPEALDRAVWVGEDVTVLRFASDEAFGVGAAGVKLDDPDAIVESEAGFVGAMLAPDDLLDVVAHVDWALPGESGALAQGKVAGVPAKVLMTAAPFLITQSAHAHELADRLGWLG